MMTYTQEQKELLLDYIFDGVACFNIYRDIDIFHPNNRLSYYKSKTNEFVLSYSNIWQFFEEKNGYNYQEIKDLTSTILRDLTKRKELTITPTA